MLNLRTLMVVRILVCWFMAIYRDLGTEVGHDVVGKNLGLCTRLVEMRVYYVGY